MLLPTNELDKPTLPDSLIRAILQHLPAVELVRLSCINKQWQTFCNELLLTRRTLSIGPMTVKSAINTDKLHFMSCVDSIPIKTDFSSFFSDAQRRYRSSYNQIDHRFKRAKLALRTLIPVLEHLTLYATQKFFHFEQFIDNLASIWPKLKSLTVVNDSNNNSINIGSGSSSINNNNNKGNKSFEWSKFCVALNNLSNLHSLSIDVELPSWSKCSKFEFFHQLKELNIIVRLTSLHLEPELPYDFSDSCPNIHFGLWLEYEAEYNNNYNNYNYNYNNYNYHNNNNNNNNSNNNNSISNSNSNSDPDPDPYYDVQINRWNSDSSLIVNMNKLRIKLSSLESVRWLIKHCRSLNVLYLTFYESANFYREQYLELYRVLTQFKELKELRLQFFVHKIECIIQKQTSEPYYRELRPVDLLMTSEDNFVHTQSFRTVERFKRQFYKPDNIQNLCQRDLIEIGTFPNVHVFHIDFYIDPYEFAWIPNLFTHKKLIVKFLFTSKNNNNLKQYFEQIRHNFCFHYEI